MLRYSAARSWPASGLIAISAALISLICAPACLADAIYGGSTNKAGASLEPIVVRSDQPGGAVLSVVIAWEADCSDGTIQPFSGEMTVSTETPGFGSPGGQLVIDSTEAGRFTGHVDYPWTRADGGTVTTATKLEGALMASSASGTLSAEVTIQPPAGAAAVTCSTGEIRWLASRGPNVYGGASRQGEPVVARFTRTRLKDLLFGWRARRCNDGSFVRFGDWLSNLRVARGQVRAKFTQNYQRDDGAASYRYSVRVKRSTRQAVGTFAVTWTRTFTDGTPARTCDTGVVGWRAVTG